MLKLFRRERPLEDECETDEEENELEQDSFLNVFKTPLCEKQWNENINVSYHFASIKDVAPHLSSWCFNRKMDEGHKNKIKSDLLKQQTPHLMGCIQMVRDKKLNCRVINGQHRLRAVQEILADDIDQKFHMSLMFEIYDCEIDDLDDMSDVSIHNTIEGIFKIANNNLNIKPEQDHDLLCKQIVIAMMNDQVLKVGIIDKTSGTVHKPKITAKLLFENFKAHFASEKMKCSVPDLIIKIKKINAQISTMPFIKLFGRYTPATYKQKQFERATKLGFYLNLESNMSPDIWIEMLTDI